MSKFKFICEENHFSSPVTTTTVEVSAVLLDDVVNQFELFLRGCGFNFKGNLVVLDDTEEDPANYYVNNNFDFGEWPKNNYPFAQSNNAKCELCGISKEIMENHRCYDAKCPKGTNDANQG
jgi:hypothetical protein